MVELGQKVALRIVMIPRARGQRDKLLRHVEAWPISRHSGYRDYEFDTNSSSPARNRS